MVEMRSKKYVAGKREPKEWVLTEAQAWLLQEVKALTMVSLPAAVRLLASTSYAFEKQPFTDEQLYSWFAPKFCEEQKLEEDVWVPVRKFAGDSRIAKKARQQGSLSNTRILATSNSVAPKPAPSKRPRAELNLRILPLHYVFDADSGKQLTKIGLIGVCYERHTRYLFYKQLSDFEKVSRTKPHQLYESFKQRRFRRWLAEIRSELGNMPVRCVILPEHTPGKGLAGLLFSSPPKAIGDFDTAMRSIADLLGKPSFDAHRPTRSKPFTITLNKQFGSWLSEVSGHVDYYNNDPEGLYQVDPPADRLRRAKAMWED